MEIYFQRDLVGRIDEVLQLRENLIALVMGARRTGKTTAIRQMLAIAEGRGWRTVFHSFDGPEPGAKPLSRPRQLWDRSPEKRAEALEGLRSVWQQARQLSRDHRYPVVLALDEIQGVPNWQDEVKALWDQDRNAGSDLKVVMAGSAPLLLAAAAADRLLGRYLPVDCPHWSFAEMKEVFSFSLDRYLFFGGYPFSGGEDAWRDFVRGIIGDYFLADLLATVPDIRKKDEMMRLLPEVICYAGIQIGYDKLSRATPKISNTETLVRYLEYFRQMRLVTALQGYSSTPHGRRSIPKIVVHNNALISAGSSHSFDSGRADGAFWGRLVENAVGAHLLQTLDRRAGLFYWRSDKDEVDYVVEQDGCLFAIEVKSSLAGKPSGLGKFRKAHAGALTRMIPSSDMSLERFLSCPAGDAIEQWKSESS